MFTDDVKTQDFYSVLLFRFCLELKFEVNLRI